MANESTLSTSAANDTLMPDASTATPPRNPRKRKDKPEREKDKQAHVLHQTTFRNPPWIYLHLVLSVPSAAASVSSPPDVSPLLVSPLLTSALRAYLGTTGAAIPVDIVKTRGVSVWIRVPREDARGVRAALASWVGSVEGADVGGGGGRTGVAWRVCGYGGVLGLVGGAGGDGADVFG